MEFLSGAAEGGGEQQKVEMDADVGCPNWWVQVRSTGALLEEEAEAESKPKADSRGKQGLYR